MTRIVYLKAPKSTGKPAAKSAGGRNKPKRGAVLETATAKKPSKKTKPGSEIVYREGKRRTVHTLDANSASFGKQLNWVFAQNVKKARKANRRVIGKPDLAVAKT
jgi:hypothetical protein